MPLVQWVDDGFDGAADAMNRTDDSFWSVDATTGPPCGFCISWKAPTLRLTAAATNRHREIAGLRRFLQELERVRNRRRRMWIELRGAHFTASGAGRNDRHGHHRNNDDDDDDDDEIMRRLFGDALPRHPLLDELRIVRCHLDDANEITLNELFRGLSVTTLHGDAPPYPRNGSSLSPPILIPTPPTTTTSCLRNLHLNGSRLGGDALDSLARMLASNAASSLLSLAVMDCDFGLANMRACNDLLLALEGNTHLINLRLAFPEAQRSGPVCREAATALGKSNVQCLKLRNQHPSTAPSLLYGLRSNRILEELHLSLEDDDDESTMVQQFQDLVKNFNFVLREVRLYRDGFVWMYPMDQQRHFEPWLQRRNVAVRSAYHGLVRCQFRVRQLSLWDRAMERLSSKPDLLYRFLRVGNLDLLDRHLGSGPPKQQTKLPLRRTGFVIGGTGSSTDGNYQVIFL